MRVDQVARPIEDVAAFIEAAGRIGELGKDVEARRPQRPAGQESRAVLVDADDARAEGRRSGDADHAQVAGGHVIAHEDGAGGARGSRVGVAGVERRTSSRRRAALGGDEDILAVAGNAGGRLDDFGREGPERHGKVLGAEGSELERLNRAGGGIDQPEALAGCDHSAAGVAEGHRQSRSAGRERALYVGVQVEYGHAGQVGDDQEAIVGRHSEARRLLGDDHGGLEPLIGGRQDIDPVAGIVGDIEDTVALIERDIRDQTTNWYHGTESTR